MANSKDLVLGSPSVSQAKTCKKCKKAPKDYVTCINCGKVMHPSCALLLKVQDLGNNQVKCCSTTDLEGDKNDGDLNLSITSSNESDQDDFSDSKCVDSLINHFSKLVEQKDHVILQQQSVISTLENQIKVLQNTLSVMANFNSTNVNKNTSNVLDHSSTDQISMQSTTDASHSLTPSAVNETEDNNLNLRNDGFIKVTKNKNNKNKSYNQKKGKQPLSSMKAQTSGENSQTVNEAANSSGRIATSVIKGTAANNPGGLKSANQMAYLHVFNLAPETTAKQIEDYLVPMFPGLVCEKLNSKFKHYSSFKLTLPFEHLESVKNADLWPVNAKINRFFHSTNRKKNTK